MPVIINAVIINFVMLIADADVFIPNLGMSFDKFRKHLDALAGVQIDDVHAVLTKPVDTALEIHGLADDNGPDPELPNQPAAIPARSEGRDHDRVAVVSLASGFSKRISLAVDRRIVLL